MDTRIRVHYITDPANFKCKHTLLKRLLHLTFAKPAQISTSFVRGAVGVLGSKLRKSVLVAVDLGRILFQDVDCLGFGACDFGLYGY
jgi:hypothetical protein